MQYEFIHDQHKNLNLITTIGQHFYIERHYFVFFIDVIISVQFHHDNTGMFMFMVIDFEPLILWYLNQNIFGFVIAHLPWTLF